MKDSLRVEFACLLLNCKDENLAAGANAFYRSIAKAGPGKSQPPSFLPITIAEAQLALMRKANEARELFPVDHLVMPEVTDRFQLDHAFRAQGRLPLWYASSMSGQ